MNTTPLVPPLAPQADDQFLTSFQLVRREIRSEEREHLECDGTPPLVPGSQAKLLGQGPEYHYLGSTRFRKGEGEAAILALYRESDEPAHRDHVLEQPAHGGVVVGFIHSIHGRKPIYRVERSQR